MAEIAIAEIDVEPLTISALKVLRAITLHAFTNRNTAVHKMPVGDFCRLAGLPIMSEDEIAPLLADAHRALGIVEVIDSADPDRDDLPSGSWQLIKDARVNGTHVLFEVSKYTYYERIRNILLSITPESMRVKSNSTRSLE